jgi:hypothetical protein
MLTAVNVEGTPVYRGGVVDVRAARRNDALSLALQVPILARPEKECTMSFRLLWFESWIFEGLENL